MFIKEFSGRVVFVVSCKRAKYKRVWILLKCRRRETPQPDGDNGVMESPLF